MDKSTVSRAITNVSQALVEVFKVTSSDLEANGSEEKVYVLKHWLSGLLTKYWVGYYTTFRKTSSKNNTLSWFNWIFSLFDVVLFFKHDF